MVIAVAMGDVGQAGRMIEQGGAGMGGMMVGSGDEDPSRSSATVSKGVLTVGGVITSVLTSPGTVPVMGLIAGCQTWTL